MSTPAFLLFCFCFGMLAAFAWLLWRYRGAPSIRAVRSDFVRRRPEPTLRGRILYLVRVAALIIAGAAFVGVVERSARGAVGWALSLGPLFLLMYCLPRPSHR